ncbi:hypothetical protein EGW08_008023 [Elysia chlorotica]|uniref:Sodium/calcium exchanger membrane region domain-containing protein n=1 Tax=Elysia chlorotica TaxID=188477 RepID=A0A433TRH2_ELYCH|nr:hypothetical protein EGW08_008023 [Elysia chlorotica]
MEQKPLVSEGSNFSKNTQRTSNSPGMTGYGSAEHSSAQVECSISHQEGGRHYRERGAKSEEIRVPDVEGLGAAFNAGSQQYSINGDGCDLRKRSKTNNRSPATHARRTSDPIGTRRRWLEVSGDTANHSVWGKSGEHRHLSHSGHHRPQLHVRSTPKISGAGGRFYLIEATNDNDFNIVEEAANEVEARKMINNHMFGIYMWMGQVSHQPSDSESDLYHTDSIDSESQRESTLSVSTIMYAALLGWWMALLYGVVGCLMFITILGRDHGRMCFGLAKYFSWPFGKYVHRRNFSEPRGSTRAFDLKTISKPCGTANDKLAFAREEATGIDAQPSLLDVVVQPHTTEHDIEGNQASVASKDATAEDKTGSGEKGEIKINKTHWRKPSTYIWLILGAPVLVIAHTLTFCLSWFFIATIPIARINWNAVTKVLFSAPTDIHVNNSPEDYPSAEEGHSEIVLCVHTSFNLHYFKCKVDGVNIVLVNLLVFVVLAIILGFVDKEYGMVSPILKCIIGMLAIMPVTYYIGMAITCISAQSSFAVGAILNATFGSIVVVILYIIMLKEGVDKGETCYAELVKSTLTGSILCCILLCPGISMVVGGLKYRRQNFNHNSANISSSLLFVAVMGVFAPTIFSKLYGNLTCDVCQVWINQNATSSNETGFICSGCKTVTRAPYNDNSLYSSHIVPLLYSCAIILPLSYIIGLLFSMKTHTKEIFEEFELLQKAEGPSCHETGAQWTKTKSVAILLLSVTAISLCSEIIADNIAPLLNVGSISEYFVGVGLLSIVGMLPELVNGVLFALQNNVNLGIEIGSAAAIQVCMVQLPIIVLADLIYPLGFSAVFNDIHLWAVIFAVIIINYVFQDGKSDYFQGSIVMFIYILLMAMYFFTVTPEAAVCRDT